MDFILEQHSNNQGSSICYFFKYKENFEPNKIDGSPFTYKGLFKDTTTRDLPKIGGVVNEEKIKMISLFIKLYVYNSYVTSKYRYL